jgi:hypothetical protein
MTAYLEFIADEFPALRTDIVANNPSRACHDYCRLRRRAILMERALIRVARLNHDAGEIGAGMLRTIVSEAREALNP